MQEELDFKYKFYLSSFFHRFGNEYWCMDSWGDLHGEIEYLQNKFKVDIDELQYGIVKLAAKELITQGYYGLEGMLHAWIHNPMCLNQLNNIEIWDWYANENYNKKILSSEEYVKTILDIKFDPEYIIINILELAEKIATEKQDGSWEGKIYIPSRGKDGEYIWGEPYKFDGDLPDEKADRQYKLKIKQRENNYLYILNKLKNSKQYV